MLFHCSFAVFIVSTFCWDLRHAILVVSCITSVILCHKLVFLVLVRLITIKIFISRLIAIKIFNQSAALIIIIRRKKKNRAGSLAIFPSVGFDHFRWQ